MAENLSSCAEGSLNEKVERLVTALMAAIGRAEGMKCIALRC